METPLKYLAGLDSDLDSDGLSGIEELLQFTNDMCADTDNDGMDDGEDACPRCSSDTHRGEVYTALVEGLFDLSSGNLAQDPIYVHLRDAYDSFDLDADANRRVIPIHDSELQYLILYFEYELLENVDILEPVDIVVIPGLVYVFRCRFECGLRCGWQRMVFLIDLPVFGPVYLGSRVISWV